jgi:hypothetical protein
MKQISQSFFLHEIKPSVVASDIQLFLKDALAGVVGDSHPAGWLTEAKLNALVEKSNGLFIFAATVVKYIELGGRRDAGEQLDIILSTKAPDISPYGDLDVLYRRLVYNALAAEDGLDSGLQKYFELVIGTIVFLFDPLSLLALEKLLTVGRHTMKQVLSRLSSVIIMPKKDEEPIRVWHPSFPEFLKDDSRSSNFFIEPSARNRHIVLHCLECMNNSLKEDICGVNDPSKLNSEIVDLKLRVQARIPSELQYSCIHWVSHLLCLRSSDEASEQILESIQLFTFNHLLHWIEVLSLLQRLDVAIPALKQAREWCMVSV